MKTHDPFRLPGWLLALSLASMPWLATAADATDPAAFGPIGADPVARATSAKDGTFRLLGLSDAEWAVATVETTTRPASATAFAR